MSPASAIPILRFRAGTVPCGVAAREVRGVRPAPADGTPLWKLLHVPCTADETGTWRVALASGQTAAEILVQGPVEVVDIKADALLRPPPALVLTNRDLIFGFVRLARELVVLLDIPTLVELASYRS